MCTFWDNFPFENNFQYSECVKSNLQIFLLLSSLSMCVEKFKHKRCHNLRDIIYPYLSLSMWKLTHKETCFISMRIYFFLKKIFFFFVFAGMGYIRIVKQSESKMVYERYTFFFSSLYYTSTHIGWLLENPSIHSTLCTRFIHTFMRWLTKQFALILKRAFFEVVSTHHRIFVYSTESLKVR